MNIWKDDKKQDYVDSLDINRINNVCDNLQKNNSGIQSMTNELYDLMVSSANYILKGGNKQS